MPEQFGNCVHLSYYIVVSHVVHTKYTWAGESRVEP